MSIGYSRLVTQDEAGNQVRLQDKVAVVVGGGRGIGKAIAVRFGREGALVAVVEKDISFAESVAEEIDEKGKRSLAVRADVASGTEVEEAFRLVDERFGAVEIVVNCAAIREDAPFHLATGDAWDEVSGTNLKGSFHCAQAANRRMAEHKGGRIIFFASPFPPGVAGKGQACYSAASAGVEGLTKALAVELGPYNIRVNCIAPDYIDTNMTREAARKAGMYLDDFKKLVVALIPLRRMGSPEEVANLAVFLASDEASFITGQIIGVKGGP